MKRINRSMFATIGAGIAGLMMFLGTISASAQIAWNPPCTATKVVNATNCRLTLQVRTTAGIITVNVNPGQSAPFVVPAGTLVGGIITQAGTYVPLTVPGGIIPSPPKPVAGVVSAGSVSNVTFGPAPGCCFDVYFDSSTAPGCYIWVVPAAGPPPCIP
jgi:hypothetical protein